MTTNPHSTQPQHRQPSCLPPSLTKHDDLDLGLVLAGVVDGLDGVRSRVAAAGHEHGQLGAVVLRVDVAVVAGAQLGAVQTPGGGRRRLALHAHVELERRAGVDCDVPQVRAVNVRSRCWRRERAQ